MGCENKHPAKKIEQDYLAMNYYSQVYLADSLFITKNFEDSYTILNKLFSKIEPIDLETYNEVVTMMKLKVILKKQPKLADFEELIFKYGYPLSYLENDSILSDYYKKINKSKRSNLEKKYLSNLDMKLRANILEMKERDQLVRKNYNEKKADSVDLINQALLIEIFKNKGFPSKTLIGGYSVDSRDANIGAILLHTDDSVRLNYFMPKILDYIRKGEARPRLYGIMKDQYLIYNNQEQYYGTYITKKRLNIPLAELNNRRKSIGLPNYGYHKWRTKEIYGEDTLSDF